MIHSQGEDALSLFVQSDGVLVHQAGVLHAVVHGGDAAAYLHIVNPLGRFVVVVGVALGHLHLDVVLALQAEHRMSEGVFGLRRVGRVLEGQRHNGPVAKQVGGGVGLVAEVAEVVVAHLLIGQFHRAVVDAVVDGVVFQLGVADCDGIHVLVAACEGGVFRREAVGQVYDLAHLSFLEQRGIAVAIHLLHFPAHGRQHHLVFASGRIGQHLHQFAFGLHHGLVTLSARMLVGCLALCAVGVQVVIDEP